MNLLYHRSDTQYHLLRKILGTLQGYNDGGGSGSGSTGLNVTATGVSKVVSPVFTNYATQALTAGYYATNLFEIPNACRLAGKETILQSALLSDTSALGVDTYLVIKNNSNDDNIAQNTPAALTADVPGIVAVVVFDDFTTLGGTAFNSVRSIGTVLPPPASGTSLWGVLITGGAPLYPSGSNLSLKLGFLQD
jgi:hypothetical protein